MLDDLLKERDALPAGTPPAEPLVKRIEDERNSRNTASTKAKEAATKIALVDDLLKAIDTFSVANHSIPQGGHGSPFVAAALHEELHDPDPNTPSPYAAVLYLKASSGSADQVFKDRLVRDGQFSGVASISLSYWLIDVPGSTVLKAGVAMGTARIKGTVNGDITIDPIT